MCNLDEILYPKMSYLGSLGPDSKTTFLYHVDIFFKVSTKCEEVKLLFLQNEDRKQQGLGGWGGGGELIFAFSASLSRSDGCCQLLSCPCVRNSRHWLNCCLTKQKLLIELMHLCVGIDLAMSLANAWQEDVEERKGHAEGIGKRNLVWL